MKTACVILADGFEEVEAITPIDYLRRAGVEVSILGVGGQRALGSHGIEVGCDTVLDSADPALFDLVVVPGGGVGARNLAASRAAIDLIRRHFDEGRLVGAICAAPAVVLHGACGILAGRRFTGYPGTEEQVKGATFVADRVVMDGNLVTARAAGCAGEFARALVAVLVGKQAAAELAGKVLLA